MVNSTQANLKASYLYKDDKAKAVISSLEEHHIL